MSDLVERLRELRELSGLAKSSYTIALGEAADEIERLRAELAEDASWNIVCRFLDALGITGQSWHETTPEQIERAITTAKEQRNEIERLRATVTQQRELLCELVEWPADLPLLTVAELEILKAASAAGGKSG